MNDNAIDDIAAWHMLLQYSNSHKGKSAVTEDGPEENHRNHELVSKYPLLEVRVTCRVFVSSTFGEELIICYYMQYVL